MSFNILVVDDSETMRAVIKKTVNLTGIPVGDLLEAENGKEAMAVLDDAWVDVVLTDINMPEMGGMELLREMKSLAVLQNIPVIFISTETSKIKKEEAEQLGIAAYIQKPFNPETIKTILLDVLNKAYQTRMEAVEETVTEPDEDFDF